MNCFYSSSSFYLTFLVFIMTCINLISTPGWTSLVHKLSLVFCISNAEIWSTIILWVPKVLHLCSNKEIPCNSWITTFFLRFIRRFICIMLCMENLCLVPCLPRMTLSPCLHPPEILFLCPLVSRATPCDYISSTVILLVTHKILLLLLRTWVILLLYPTTTMTILLILYSRVVWLIHCVAFFQWPLSLIPFMTFWTFILSFLLDINFLYFRRWRLLIMRLGIGSLD